MRNLLFGLGMVSMLAACSTSTNDVVVSNNEDAPQKEQVAEVTPNRLLTLDIDGMVCQMGCGGSIRKELNAVEGVGECNFDFEEGRETNVATIEFDKELISADEITKIISTINDNQFTVGESSADVIEAEETETADVEETSKSPDGKSSVTMSSSTGFQLPNLLEIFSSLLTN